MTAAIDSSPEAVSGRAFLGIALLLWSTVIGEDPPWPEQTPLTPTVEASARTMPQDLPKGTRLDRPAWATSRAVRIDREVFLAAFKRQARAGLLSCLATWQPSPSSLALTATLGREGRLVDPVPLDGRVTLPACALEALLAMNFAAVVDELDRPSIVIQWRIDW